MYEPEETFGFDFNLDFLNTDVTAPVKIDPDAVAQEVCENRFTNSLPATAQKKKRQHKNTIELAKRISQTDELVQQLLQKTQELHEFKECAKNVGELYEKEKLLRIELDKRMKQLQLSHESLEGKYEHTKLLYDQMQGQWENSKGPIEYSDLAVRYVKLTQKLDEEHLLHWHEQAAAESISKYCQERNLRVPPVKSPKKRVRVYKSEKATQCEILTKCEASLEQTLAVAATQVRSQGTQTSVKTHTQSTQHINTTTTRSTSTACFIKQHHVGTSFPEPSSFSAADAMMKEVLEWTIPAPITPISDLPEAEIITTTTGTCTYLCNVQREIDFVSPIQTVSIKHSYSRPPSRLSVKHETSTRSPTPTNMPLASNLLQFSSLTRLTSPAFEELWQLFGPMIYGLLQNRVRSNATNNSMENNFVSSLNQQELNSWMYSLFDSMQQQQQEQQEQTQPHNKAETPTFNTPAPMTATIENIENRNRIIRPQPCRENLTNEQSTLYTDEDSGVPQHQSIATSPIRIITSQTTMENERLFLPTSSIACISSAFRPHKKRVLKVNDDAKKDINENKIVEAILKIFPNTLNTNKKRKRIEKLLMNSNYHKRKRGTVRKKSKNKTKVTIANIRSHQKEETAVEFLKSLLNADSSNKTSNLIENQTVAESNKCAKTSESVVQESHAAENVPHCENSKQEVLKLPIKSRSSLVYQLFGGDSDSDVETQPAKETSSTNDNKEMLLADENHTLHKQCVSQDICSNLETSVEVKQLESSCQFFNEDQNCAKSNIILLNKTTVFDERIIIEPAQNTSTDNSIKNKNFDENDMVLVIDEGVSNENDNNKTNLDEQNKFIEDSHKHIINIVKSPKKLTLFKNSSEISLQMQNISNTNTHSTLEQSHKTSDEMAKEDSTTNSDSLCSLLKTKVLDDVLSNCTKSIANEICNKTSDKIGNEASTTNSDESLSPLLETKVLDDVLSNSTKAIAVEIYNEHTNDTAALNSTPLINKRGRKRKSNLDNLQSTSCKRSARLQEKQIVTNNTKTTLSLLSPTISNTILGKYTKRKCMQKPNKSTVIEIERENNIKDLMDELKTKPSDVDKLDIHVNLGYFKESSLDNTNIANSKAIQNCDNIEQEPTIAINTARNVANTIFNTNTISSKNISVKCNNTKSNYGKLNMLTISKIIPNNPASCETPPYVQQLVLGSSNLAKEQIETNTDISVCSAIQFADCPASPKAEEISCNEIKQIPTELQLIYHSYKSKSLLERLIDSNSSVPHKVINGEGSKKVQAKRKEHFTQMTACIQKYLEYAVVNHEAEAVHLSDQLHKCSNNNYELIIDAVIETIKSQASTVQQTAEDPYYHDSILPAQYIENLDKQNITHLLRRLQFIHADFITTLLAKIEAVLFTISNAQQLALNVILNLTQLYLNAVRNQSLHMTGNPARLFIAKSLYYYNLKSSPMIYEVLCCFPTALPHREERSYDRSDALITVIQHVLMSTKYDMDKSDLRSKELLSKLRYQYHFEPFKPSRDEVLANLLEKLKTGKLSNIKYSFAVFCKRIHPNRVQTDILDTLLMPLANEFYTLVQQTTDYDERVVALLESIAFIIKPFPIESNIDVYLALMTRFLHVVKRPIIQEAAMQAILLFQRFGYANCYNALRHFRPNHELHANTRAMLKTFIHRKPYSFWKALKAHQNNT